jgi:hypothetical protein
MNSLFAALSRYIRHPEGGRSRKSPARACAGRRPRRLTLGVEQLERRDVPSALSVADVTVREGPTSLGALDPAGGTALGLAGPRIIAFDDMPGSPHYHDLFVTSYQNQEVLRFDWASQTYQPFVAPHSGGMTDLAGLAFGPDGNLYLSTGSQSSVLEFDGTTGSFLGTFVPAGYGGLNWAGGMAFAPDGDLYVCSRLSNQILKYEGPTSPDGLPPGQFLGVFANTQHISPFNFDFGPDGNVYVSCPEGVNNPATPDSFVDRYYGPSSPLAGQFIDTFVANGTGGLNDSRTPLFDQQGNLYVADNHLNEVLEFQGPNGASPGAYIQAYVTTGQGNLAAPNGLAIGPDANLYVSSRDANQVTRFAPSSQASFAVTLDSASASQVSVDYATADGTATAGSDYVQTSGTLVFPAGDTSETINVPIVSVATGGPTKTFTLDLSNPVDATITRDQGTGTILNRMTKFYCVDGGAPSTFEYGSGGTSEEVYPQLSGNTAPRGVATTTAGTTAWVVDANKNVYVYSNHGVLLGSWSAGGLSSSAQLTGITTDGTDIWLLDNYTATVYKYSGAAGLLSGTQSADSSFPLDNANTNPHGIVTDGVSLWSVDAGITGQVFKYTLTGSLLGSWAIDPANSHPTGLTINPNNVSDIWIVDNGTLQVYQYTAAAGLTSGSQNASATFALNPYDTNPQGIADPPPPDMLLPPPPAPALPELPATVNATASAVPSAVAGVASLADRDTAFAVLVRESLPRPGGPSTDQTAGNPTPVAGGALPPADASGRQKPLEGFTPLALGGSRGVRSGRSAVGLLDGTLIDEESQPSAAALDSFFARQAEDAPAEK